MKNPTRVEFTHPYIDKDGNPAVYKRAIYLELGEGNTKYRDSLLADIAMEKFIPEEEQK